MRRFSMVLLLSLTVGISSGQVGFRAFLDVSSDPPRCNLFLDGEGLGVTPIRGVEIAGGRHILTTKLNWYRTRVDTFDVKAGETVVRSYRLEPAAGLRVTSVPQDAGVYVNNVYRGKTPLEFYDLPPGPVDINIERRDFYGWKGDTVLTTGVMDTIAATLVELPSFITLGVEPPGVLVSVNGGAMVAGPVADVKIPSGFFSIKAQNPRTGEEIEEEGFARARNQHYVVRFDTPSRRAFIYSLLYPGCGQYVNGSRREGILFGSAFTASGAVFCFGWLRFIQAKHDYEGAYAEYLNATVPDDAVAKRGVLQHKFDEWKKAATLRNIAGGIMIGIYAASLIEAFFVHDTEDVIDQTADAPTQSGLNVTPHDVRFAFRIRL